MSNLIGAALDAPLIGVSVRWPKTLHAVTMEQVIHGWREGTFVSACGRRGLRLMGTGGKNEVAAPWPPALRGLGSDTERCAACWAATGRKRPRCHRAEVKS